jgi:hypothetical protein
VMPVLLRAKNGRACKSTTPLVVSAAGHVGREERIREGLREWGVGQRTEQLFKKLLWWLRNCSSHKRPLIVSLRSNGYRDGGVRVWLGRCGMRR